MTPKETYTFVLERAKRCTLIDRCGLTVHYIALWVGGVCSVFPIQSAFFPREYFTVTALGIPFVLVLLAWAIWEWLKWRHL